MILQGCHENFRKMTKGEKNKFKKRINSENKCKKKLKKGEQSAKKLKKERIFKIR